MTGDRIEHVEQGEQPLGLVPGIARDRLRRRQRVGRRGTLGRRGRHEQLVARIGRHPRGATGERVRERSEIGHRRRLAAVERVLNGPAPAAGLQIDEVRHIARGDAQAERVTLDRRAVEELRVRPDRGDGRHLVDGDIRRGRATKHRQKRDRRIVAAPLLTEATPPLATR